MISFLQICMTIMLGLAERWLGRQSPRTMCVESLLSKYSFRFNSQRLTLSAVRNYWKVLMGLTFRARTDRLHGCAALGMALHQNDGFRHRFHDYVLDLDDVSLNQFACYYDPPNYLSWFSRSCLVLIATLLYALTVPVAVFSRSVGPLLRVAEIFELALWLDRVRSLRLERIYFVSAYDRTCNLFCYLGKRLAGTRVSRIPSCNPLVWYKSCVCDEFIFTSPAQLDEYERMKCNWSVLNTRLWKPFSVIHVDRSVLWRDDSADRTLLYISSGYWLRAEDAYTLGDDGEWYVEAERLLLNEMRQFVDDESDVNLIVCPHPHEKKNRENLQRCRQFHDAQLGHSRYVLLSEDESWKDRVHDASLMVATFSTAIAEALYLGHKAINAPLAIPMDIFDFGPDAIRCNSVAGFRQRVRELLAMSTPEFFARSRLLKYHHCFYESRPAREIEVPA